MFTLFQALQDELEKCSNQVRCAEKKLLHKEMESQEQVGSPLLFVLFTPIGHRADAFLCQLATLGCK
jgi:hypothetical protein